MKWRIKHPNPKKIKNILVVKNDRIGDIILSSCTFRELKRAYPKSKITLIASKENESIIKKNKFIDFVYISDHSPRNYEEFKRYFSIIRRLRKTKFDLGVELRGGFYNILMMYLAGAKYRIGFYSQLPGKYLLHYGRTKKKYKNKKIHHSKMRIEVLNTGLGIGSTNNWPDIATDKNDEKIMRTLMKKHGLKSNQFISIIPDASMDKKAWPLNRYNELIKRLHKKYPKKKIVLLGTDKEKIEWLANNGEIAYEFFIISWRMVAYINKVNKFILFDY